MDGYGSSGANIRVVLPESGIEFDVQLLGAPPMEVLSFPICASHQRRLPACRCHILDVDREKVNMRTACET